MKTEIIGVIGLGYVGMPLAASFSRKMQVVGFDLKSERVGELLNGFDRTGEVAESDLKNSNLTLTSRKADLNGVSFFIVATPTPIDSANIPDLSMLLSATETVAGNLKKGDVVVYESTVYPGATEDECVPILEKISGLKMGSDFMVGFSPERINPGDKEHSFENITKVVSGNDAEALERIAGVYQQVVEAGVFRASSIRVAEASKVLENTQRDLNIALMNEVSLICDRMGIDTLDVLKAAGTKWNFLNFFPGLVGGHCIGVDPYYLTHKAEQLNYTPDVILAGRRVNDQMGEFVARKTIREIVTQKHDLGDACITVLGLTFKEDCSDIRNTRVVDIIKEFQDLGIEVQVHDPIAYPDEALKEYGIELIEWGKLKPANAIVLAVGHKEYKKLSHEDYVAKLKPRGLLGDIKGILDRQRFAENGIRCWRL